MLKRTFSLSGALALACLLSASLTAHSADAPPARLASTPEGELTTFFNPQCKRCHFCPTRSEDALSATEKIQAQLRLAEPGLMNL